MWLRFSHRSREALARLGWPRPFVKEHRDSNEVSGEFKGMYATAPVRASRQNRPFRTEELVAKTDCLEAQNLELALLVNC